MDNKPTLKDYPLSIPDNPLRLRRGLTYLTLRDVGYFYLVGMPHAENVRDFGIDTPFLLVADGGPVGEYYPARYDTGTDTWRILDNGIRYVNGKAYERIMLPDTDDTDTESPDAEVEYPSVWTPDGIQTTFTAPAVQPNLL